MTTRIAPHIELRDEERSQLTRWARGRRTPARLVLRAQIVLVAPEGRDTHDIAVLLGTSRQTVGRWRQRFAALELAEGKVLATCLPRHRHQEWLPFLRLIDQQTPQNQTLHLIEDNDATQKQSDFSTQFADDSSNLPLGETPVLLAKIQLKRRDDGGNLLCMHPEKGEGIELGLNEVLLHSFSKLLGDAVSVSGWDIDLKISREITGEETAPDRVN